MAGEDHPRQNHEQPTRAVHCLRRITSRRARCHERAPLDHCVVVVCRLPHQLFRPANSFLRTAPTSKGFPSRQGLAGSGCVGVLLDLYDASNSDRAVRGPDKPALALRGRFRALVAGAGTNRICRFSGYAAGVSDAARRRRVDLPGRRNESGEPVVSLVTARAALRAFRRRHTHRAGIGRADDWLAVADFRLANHVHHRRVRRAGVVGALVPGNPGANARHVGGRRAHSNYLGPIRDPVAQPRFVGSVAGLLLF